MNNEVITITDRNYREPMTTEMQQYLKEHEQENIRRAEEKENYILEKSWQKYLERREKLEKIIQNIKQIITKQNKKHR